METKRSSIVDNIYTHMRFLHLNNLLRLLSTKNEEFFLHEVISFYFHPCTLHFGCERRDYSSSVHKQIGAFEIDLRYFLIYFISSKTEVHRLFFYFRVSDGEKLKGPQLTGGCRMG
jgi:hypothetical protein